MDFFGVSQTQSRTGTLEATTTLEAFEEVTVPAGTFETIRLRHTDTIIFDDDPQNPVVEEEIHWNVKGIGRVRRDFLDKGPEDSHHRDVLVAYSVPGEPGEPGEPDNSFSTWVSEYDLQAGEASPAANPSGDGVPNKVKYALGLDPRRAVRDQFPMAEVEEINEENYMVMDIPLNGEAENIAVLVEVSGSLESWDRGPEHVTVVEETDSFLRVRDNTPLSSADERFFRLRVESNGGE